LGKEYKLDHRVSKVSPKVIFYTQVATFIVQKILLDNLGLCYICAKPERLFAVGSLLVYMVLSHPVQPSAPARLLKHIIRCFHRLSDNPR
jgi:CCR4-NOT transcription complex subunit 9